MIGANTARFVLFCFFVFTPRDFFKQGGSDREDEPACGQITDICVRVCMCVCQREKLIKEKKLIVHAGRRLIETACDLPHIGASLVGLGFSRRMLLLCEALHRAASSVTKIMSSFFLIMGAEKDKIVKHYLS